MDLAGHRAAVRRAWSAGQSRVFSGRRWEREIYPAVRNMVPPIEQPDRLARRRARRHGDHGRVNR